MGKRPWTIGTSKGGRYVTEVAPMSMNRIFRRSAVWLAAHDVDRSPADARRKNMSYGKPFVITWSFPVP